MSLVKWILICQYVTIIKTNMVNCKVNVVCDVIKWNKNATLATRPKGLCMVLPFLKTRRHLRYTFPLLRYNRSSWYDISIIDFKVNYYVQLSYLDKYLVHLSGKYCQTER